MKIILQQKIPGLGDKYDVIQVKSGYGRNYLIPKGYAIVANDSNQKIVQETLKQANTKADKIKQEAIEIAEKINKINLNIPTKVSEGLKIFGSITVFQIAEALKKYNIYINKKQIQLNCNIKTLGTYEATLLLHKEMKYTLKFNITAE